MQAQKDPSTQATIYADPPVASLSTAHNMPPADLMDPIVGQCIVYAHGIGARVERYHPQWMNKGDSTQSRSKRGIIEGKTRASKRNFVRFFDTIDLRYRALSFMLTYPDQFPRARHKWKTDLENFLKRLGRKLSNRRLRKLFPSIREAKIAVTWRLEFKRRKSGNSSKGQVAPHFHVLLHLRFPDQGFAGFPDELVKELETALSKDWYEVVHSEDENHLRYGLSQLNVLQEPDRVEYFYRYMAKEDTANITDAYPNGIGRSWGYWRKRDLPQSPKVVLQLTASQYKALLRDFKQRLWEEVNERTFNRLSCCVGHNYLSVLAQMPEFKGHPALSSEWPDVELNETESLVAQPFQLTIPEQSEITAIANNDSLEVRVRNRAKGLLLLSMGNAVTDAAKAVGVTAQTLSTWLKKYEKIGVDFLRDQPRRGRPKKHSTELHEQIRRLAESEPPRGHERWTYRLLAEAAVQRGYCDKISHTQVGKMLSAQAS